MVRYVLSVSVGYLKDIFYSCKVGLRVIGLVEGEGGELWC